jgi:SAM-dependent methyltransferase
MSKLLIIEDEGIPLTIGKRRAFNKFNESVYQGLIKVEPIGSCFCGENRFRLLSRYDRFGLPFGTKICLSCGLIVQTLRIHPDSMAEFYERIYWPLISGQTDFLTPTKKDEISSYLLKHISNLTKEISIFEVGCGSGARIAKIRDELKHAGYLVAATGCDYSSEAIKIAQKNGITPIIGGMKDLAASGKADILILSHVFEHFPDLREALDQLERLVHDDSLIYIEVPGVIDLINKDEYSFDYQQYCVLAHTYNFSLSTLEKVMSTRGFTLIEGDEYIRAIFKKGAPQEILVNAYEQIIEALTQAQKKSLATKAKREQPFKKYLRNIAKAILNRGT